MDPTYVSGNYPLSTEEMHQNATYIAWYLQNKSFYGLPTWTPNAIAGLLGNTQSESRHNPGAWQDYTVPGPGTITEEKGYSLTQWTPYTKYTEWAESRGLNPAAMPTALSRLYYEIQNKIQFYKTDAYPLTFLEFTQSKADPAYLGRAFLYNYERPAEPDPNTRGKQAEYWYTYITGLKFKKKKWIYMLKRKTIL